MNKKIKSAKEISLEIKSLFVNLKSKDDLADRLSTYINNITGKELINRVTIEVLIFNELKMFKEKNGNDFINYKKLNNIISQFHIFKLDLKGKKRKANPEFNNDELINQIGVELILLNLGFDAPDDNDKIINSSFNNLLLNSITTFILIYSEQFQHYYSKFGKSKNFVQSVLNDNKSFKELNDFLRKKPEIVNILENMIISSQFQCVADLIIMDLAPLKSIFVFFDLEKNIKENTEYFYRFLKEKYSRHTIQTAITRELKNIKEGRFNHIKHLV